MCAAWAKMFRAPGLGQGWEVVRHVVGQPTPQPVAVWVYIGRVCVVCVRVCVCRVLWRGVRRFCARTERACYIPKMISHSTHATITYLSLESARRAAPGKCVYAQPEK